MTDHSADHLPPDRCPGLLRPHLAADGALVRVRAPGGRLPDGGLRLLAAASRAFADGDVHLTSRGNLQVRGVVVDECGGVPTGLIESVATAGFLPSASHERVRNIVASPLSGLTGGFADVRPIIGALDAALCREPALADLPGRFLFGVDDGRGDVAGLRCDLSATALDSDRMRIGIGALSGPVVPTADAVRTLIDTALRFVAIRETRWNVRQLPGEGRELGGTAPLPRPERSRMPYGVLDGALSVRVPLGILTPSMVAALPDRGVIVTPWRGLVLPAGTDVEALTAVGFDAAEDSPWSRVSACTGAPRCSLARSDTREVARRTVAGPAPSRHVHIVGCERACGAPHFPHTLVVARSSM
ncbi:cobalamin biosynthesis protein CobG [Rhodococcus sp. HM1]|uniref:cobalamin biosynthesis protein CobG n=1 Tax=unclassified Rhodococcus (in: high G+C Gram-positive bacteria) TaxID=192944 RepID=UPI0018CFB187|nr:MULTISPECIES: cobalamin biosynthesis protein CobG [unclassified Rhodococcus (in: high G+C Gram-positive bacteria)]MBH0122147.1 cobalamin biosynthesis protein CobG [Rhodococcus sp. CX]MCK8669627.1 cobalamin biosynthesis protein CobG [Rhodococcus sp. HM1]